MEITNACLTGDQIDEIERRVNKASLGPWKSFIEGRDHTSGSSFIMTGSENRRGNDLELSGVTADDQDFIAAARQDIPLLLAEVRRLRLLVSKQGSDDGSETNMRDSN